jgi:anti-sigma regulatory factor (Ser/Thr protein kinase)
MRLEWELPTDVAGIRPVRHDVVAAARAWGVPVDLDDLALIVAELATNAVEHGLPPQVLAVRWEDGRVEVAATDHRPDDEPFRTHLSDDADRGRGIAIVEALATDWGVARDGNRKTVWAVVGYDGPVS